MNWEVYSDKLVTYDPRSPDFITVNTLFTKGECEVIRGLHTTLPFKKSQLSWGLNKDQKRDTDLYWIQSTEDSLWIFERVLNAIAHINRTHFNYILDGRISAFQLGRYSRNQGYDWHLDLGPNQASRRKLSLSIELSPESDYEGGELQFFRNGIQAIRSRQSLGNMTVFPSWMLHQVTKITRGERWSLVNWIEGPPFK
ncbi:2OG-Fe(II) oxygenase [Rapidithrix thailandica]|uniref:2OG-Fe(II) oxygenase n=1 Tax=Rapidithrix thailandica TaxID=413964 RepID=A0AAW9S9M1_9BACT